MTRLRKLSPIETLAAEICWAGFSSKPEGNPRTYWEIIAPDARRGYCETASHLAWIAGKLGHGKLMTLIEATEKSKG
jgi:hypothetical protein